MPYRKPPKWLKKSDDRILEYLEEEGTSTAAIMTDEWPMEYHPESIGRRLRQLTKAGLVEKRGRGVYKITCDGKKYLEGDDFTDLEEPE